MLNTRLSASVSPSSAPSWLLVIGTLEPAQTLSPVLFTSRGMASFTGVILSSSVAGMLLLSLSGQSRPTVLATNTRLSVRLSLPSWRYWKYYYRELCRGDTGNITIENSVCPLTLRPFYGLNFDSKATKCFLFVCWRWKGKNIFFLGISGMKVN